MLATTAYDSPDASYTFSIQRSREALHAAGIPTAYLLLSGNCHVDDARNSVVRDFLNSDCSELVFIDADVSWRPDGLIRLCSHDLDVVGGVYPYRRVGQGGMPVRALAGRLTPGADGLLEVEGLPTGFLRIRRAVIERLAQSAETFRSKDENGPVPLIFERTMHMGQRWGGDLTFARKWRDMGGQVWADCDIKLGHMAKQVLWGSLGAALRQQNGTTLRHVADRVRDGVSTPDDYDEAWHYIGNAWAAQADVLAFAVAMARKATLPIVETGSGLTTVLMAAATDQTVFAIEHEPYWANRLKDMAAEAGVENIAICHAPLVDGWYDARELSALPARFSFGLVDGPPRVAGDRMKFFAHLGARCSAVLCDDADDPAFASRVEAWAKAFNKIVAAKEARAIVIGDPA